MRLGLIGWYGHDNAGDERTLVCLRNLFEGDEIVVTHDFADAARRLDELNACDYVLLGGGGLVLRGMGRFASLFEAIEPPLGCVGLGVEARHADNLALIDVLTRKAEFIYVRDEESRRRLRHHFKVIVGPDLTFLYPYDVAPWCEEDRSAVNLRPWHYWHFSHLSMPSRLMEKLDRRLPWLENVYPLRKWEPARAVDSLKRSFAELRPLPMYMEPDSANDRDLLARHFARVDAEFRPETLAECRYLVGMRFHALVFACQMGIPFVSLSYQPKNRAFCAEAGMEAFAVDLYPPRRLEESVARMKREARALRRHLLEFRQRMTREVWQVVEPILRLIREGRR